MLSAFVTARSLKLRPEDAAELGVARYAADSLEKNLKLPFVQSLLNQNRAAQRGLYAVAGGTLLQMIGTYLGN